MGRELLQLEDYMVAERMKERSKEDQPKWSACEYAIKEPSTMCQHLK